MKKTKRIVAAVLSAAIMVNCIPVNVFALENSVLKEKRNETVSFDRLDDYIPAGNTADVTVTVEKDGYSTKIETTTSENIIYYVNDDVANDGVSFGSSGSYVLVEGKGSASGVMTTEKESEYSTLDDEAEAADTRVTEKQGKLDAAKEAAKGPNTNLASAKVQTGLASVAKSSAEKAYNDAITAQNDAQAAYDKALNAPNNLAAAIQEKKDALQAESSELTTKQNELATAQANLAKWKTDNGFSSQAEIDAAIAAKQAEYNSASGLKKIKIGAELTALKALPAVFSGLEKAIENKEAEIEAQKLEVKAAQDALDAMNEEEQMALLQQDIIDTKNALDNAIALTAEKEAAKNDAVAEYEIKAAAEAEAQKTADEANAAVSAAETELTTAQTEASSAWAAAKAAQEEFIKKLTIDDITFDSATVMFTNNGGESFGFEVEVYDELSVNVIDENNSLDTDPVVEVEGTELLNGNVYKIYDGKTAVIKVPTIQSYRYSVTGATEISKGEYTVGPVIQDTSVEIKYTEIGASSVTFESPAGAVITVKDGTNNITSGTNVKSGTTLTVTVTPDAGFTVKGYKVTDKNGEEVSLDNGTFKTNTVTEDAYTITADVSFTGSIVNAGNLGEYVESIGITVDGMEYTLGEVISEGGKTVVVSPVVKKGFKAVNMNVIPDMGTAYEVNAVNETFSFTAESGVKYTISFADEKIEDIRSSIKLEAVTNATVEILIEGEDEYVSLGDGTEITEINPGTLIYVRVTPKENHYITDATINNGDQRIKAVVSALDSSVNGVKTYKFRTTPTPYAYKINVSTATPIVAPNTNDVVINRYDITANKTNEVEDKLFTAFDKANGISALNYEYLAGTVIIPETDLVIVTIPRIEYPVWQGIDKEVPSVDTLADGVLEAIKDISPAISKLITKDMVKGILNKMENLVGNFHSFGDAEEENVRAVFTGSDNYQPTTSAPRTVKVQDLRTEIDVDINTEITVVYGSYTDNKEILNKLLDGKKGVNVEGNELADEYDAKLLINTDLVGANVGTYTVEVSMNDKDDYDYKDTEKTTATIKVTKADADVSVTENNVILYKNISALSKDYLVQVTSDVVIPDAKAGHISFLMGLDANTNDPAKPAIFATIDLSNTALNFDILGFNTADAFIKWIDSDGDGLTLEELLAKSDDIKELIKSLGVDTSVLEGYGINAEMLKTALKGVYAALEKYSEYGDIYVKFVNDETQIVPDSHGIYAVGAIIADTNYNTAADATVIVVSAEPVTVKFDDVNENNARQFKYDGTAKQMTAKAYDETGKEITGTMKYVYAGVQSDGTPYLNSKAPLHAGAYTVTALFNDAGYYRAGFAVGAMAIWPSDTAEVGVSNKIVVYDENNEKPISVSDMITVLPEGTDAKVAVITAGIDVATDFSEEGFAALEGTVNIDFPEKADTILEKIVPSAYTEEGITLKTLKNKLEEIKAGLENLGVDASAMDQIITALDELPDAAKLTFYNTYNGTVNEKALPKKIGAYLVTAIIFDPDYMPEAGAGVLLISPDITEADLSWTYNDMNGIITQPVLDTVNLSAKAEINGTEDIAATAMIKYVFVGLSKEGEIYTFTADQNNIAEISKGLRNGAYTQIAYIWNGVDAVMTVAQPIVREFIHTPQQMHIDFKPDENADNARLLIYTGKAIEMPVEIKKLDGSEIKDDCIEIKYTGIDTQGNEYNSTSAPVNAGTYVVTVTYKEYDTATSKSLKYADINVGIMIIEPAEIDVNVDIDDIECTCGCDTKSCTSEKPCCEDCNQLDLNKVITVKGKDNEIYQITVIEDTENNVNIIAPWYNGGKSMKVKDTDKVIEDIISEITKIEETYSKNKVSEYIDNLIAELEKVDTAALDKALVDAKTAIKSELESITTESVKADLKTIYKYIDELDLSSPETIAKAAEEVKALADKTETADPQLSATLNKIAAEIENIDAQTAADAAKTVKAALGIIVQAVKEADLTDIKAEAKAIRDKLIEEIEKIDAAAPGAEIDKELTKAIKTLKNLKTEIEKSENSANAAVDSVKDILKNINIKSLTINGKSEFACYGEYTVTAIAFGPNHKVGSDSDEFTITPPAHVHRGGSANCTTGAICEDPNCKEEYTPKNTSTHDGETELRYARPATATEDGYTGDLYCKSCGHLIKLGKKIPATGNNQGTSGPGESAPSDTNNSDNKTAEKDKVIYTGDISNMSLWLSLMLVSGCAVCILYFRKRKTDQK